LHLLDTSVVISLRDGDEAIEERFRTLKGSVAISSLTLAELMSGMSVEVEERQRRETRLSLLLSGLAVLGFGVAEAEAYKVVVLALGYSRTRFVDRLIAAHAITSERALVTLNARDFSGVPSLSVVDWAH
jgi:tRNA(fMet)-specific endonuclease VapC